MVTQIQNPSDAKAAIAEANTLIAKHQKDPNSVTYGEAQKLYSVLNAAARTSCCGPFEYESGRMIYAVSAPDNPYTGDTATVELANKVKEAAAQLKNEFGLYNSTLRIGAYTALAGAFYATNRFITSCIASVAAPIAHAARENISNMTQGFSLSSTLSNAATLGGNISGTTALAITALIGISILGVKAACGKCPAEQEQSVVKKTQ